jgi:hypothetical protein
VPYLAKSVGAQTHSGWSRLREELGPPAQRLSELVDKYSTLVDPEFARSVIRLSIDLDNLESGAYEKTTERRNEDLAKAMVIAEAIRYSLKLGTYIRREMTAN